MFMYADAQSDLDFHRGRVAEFTRQATAHRVARELSKDRPRRWFARWSRRSSGRPSQVTQPA